MSLFVFPEHTPLARAVTLSKSEIAELNLLREEHYTQHLGLEALAANRGLLLVYTDCFRKATAAVIDDQIWLKQIDPLTDKIRFAHEIHHVRFAPEAIAYQDLSDPEVAKYEGKATLFGALFAVPSMPEFRTEEDIYRIFGERNKDAAFHWINYYRKTRLEI